MPSGFSDHGLCCTEKEGDSEGGWLVQLNYMEHEKYNSFYGKTFEANTMDVFVGIWTCCLCFPSHASAVIFCHFFLADYAHICIGWFWAVELQIPF